jgi:hypothetical protein
MTWLMRPVPVGAFVAFALVACLRHDTVLDLTVSDQSASAPEMISMSSLVIIA